MSTENNSTGKKLIGWVFLFVVLLLLVSLSKGILELLSVYDRVDSVELEVAELQAKKISLERQLEERSSSGFVERQIRNKLHLSRPGEIVVVMPEDGLEVITEVEQATEEEEMENWQKWMDLFL